VAATRTAASARLRHGCRSLLQLEIVPKPPLERAPTILGRNGEVYKLDYGQERGSRPVGDDPRTLCVQTTRFLARHCHRQRRDRLSRVGQGHAATPRNIPGTEKIIPAQLVLFALGFQVGEPASRSARREKDPRSNAKRSTASREACRASSPPRHAPRPEPRGVGINEGRAPRECDAGHGRDRLALSLSLKVEQEERITPTLTRISCSFSPRRTRMVSSVRGWPGHQIHDLTQVRGVAGADLEDLVVFFRPAFRPGSGSVSAITILIADDVVTDLDATKPPASPAPSSSALPRLKTKAGVRLPRLEVHGRSLTRRHDADAHFQRVVRRERRRLRASFSFP